MSNARSLRIRAVAPRRRIRGLTATRFQPERSGMATCQKVAKKCQPMPRSSRAGDRRDHSFFLIRVVPELGPGSKQVVDNKQLTTCSGISCNPLPRSGLGVFQNNPIVARVAWQRPETAGPLSLGLAANDVPTGYPKEPGSGGSQVDALDSGLQNLLYGCSRDGQVAGPGRPPRMVGEHGGRTQPHRRLTDRG